MTVMQFDLADVNDTEAFGAALWAALPHKAVIFLHGELGAGKTTLLRGVLRAAGFKQVVKSPTYSLVEEYQFADRNVFHFDLYRLKDPDELAWIGMDDYLNQPALCFIEWPEMGEGVLPEADIDLFIRYTEQARTLELSVIQPTLKNKLQLHWKNKDILI